MNGKKARRARRAQSSSTDMIRHVVQFDDKGESGARLGPLRYGPDKDHWVLIFERFGPIGPDFVRKLNNVCARFRQSDPSLRLVTRPQVEELADRVDAMADWNTAGDGPVESYEGKTVHVPYDKRYAQLVLDAERMGIPLALAVGVAAKRHGYTMYGDDEAQVGA